MPRGALPRLPRAHPERPGPVLRAERHSRGEETNKGGQTKEARLYEGAGRGAARGVRGARGLPDDPSSVVVGRGPGEARLVTRRFPPFPPLGSLADARGCSFEASRRRCPRRLSREVRRTGRRARDERAGSAPQRSSQSGKTAGWRGPSALPSRAPQAATKQRLRRLPGAAKISTGIDGLTT